MANSQEEWLGDGLPPVGLKGGTLPSLRRNFAWTSFGNIVFSGCNWAMILVIAKFGTPRMVGQYAIGQAVTGPIIVFAQLKLRYLLISDSDQSYYRFGDYLGLRMIAITLAMAVIAAITLGGHCGETAVVILAMGAFGSVEALSDIIYGLMQKNEQMRLIALSMAFRGPLWLATMAAAVYLTRGLLWGVIGLSFISVLVLVLFDIPNGARLLSETAAGGQPGDPTPAPSLRRYARLAWLALPIGLTVMVNSLSGNISRYYLEENVGEYGLGIFAVVASLGGIVRTVTGALCQSVCPRLARLYAGGHRAGFISLLWKFIGISALVGAVPLAACVVAGEDILSLLFKPEYAREVEVLVWLMASGVQDCILSGLGTGLTAARYFRLQVPLSIVGLLTAALTSHLLIPSGGLRGAAISAFATSSCLLLCYLIAMYHLIHKSVWVTRGGGDAYSRKPGMGVGAPSNVGYEGTREREVGR